MFKYLRIHHRWWSIVLGLWLYLLGHGCTFAATDQTIKFTASLIEPTCDLSGTQYFRYDATLSEIIAAGAKGYNPQDITIRFSNCKGSGIPKVTISADEFGAGVYYLDGDIPLFRNTLSTSKGLGMLLIDKNTGTALKTGDDIVVGKSTNDLSANIPKDLVLTVSLSCGSCDRSQMETGSFAGRVMLRFAYD